MNHGFVRVGAAIPSVSIADCHNNTKSISNLIKQAHEQGAEIVCFPELSITAYTCGDLFLNQLLLDESELALNWLIEETSSLDIVSIVGMPVRLLNQLFNAAVVFQQGKILAVVPKTYLPNNNEFYEKRWFASALDTNEKSIELAKQTAPFGKDIILRSSDLSFSIEICEDLWMPIPPSSNQSLAGSQLVFNLSASNELINKHCYRKQLVAQQSARCVAGYVYVSAGFGESSTDLVFAGNALIAENGVILSEGERFALNEQLIVNDVDIERLLADRHKNSSFLLQTETTPFRFISFEHPKRAQTNLLREISPAPFIPSGNELSDRCREIFNIQVNALATRLHHTGLESVVLGISGGLDSTLSLLVCVKTFDKMGLSRKNIHGITMPGFGTSTRTHQNACLLMEQLNISFQEIDIKQACLQHFKDIEHDENIFDVVYENTQARERTQLLMDVANQINALVIGTGDLSELALGWATYNGDHMSMYAVNSSIPKTLVRFLVQWVCEHEIENSAKTTLLDILDTPVSPELLPTDNEGEITQKTENLVGPYELHDFFLYYMLRFGFRPAKIFYLAIIAFEQKYDDAVIKKWFGVFMRRFFSQQFKRSCMPDGPKVGSVNLSPRGDWRMPSDASARMWMKEVDNL